MKAETKFDIDQKAFYLENNKVVSAVVQEVSVLFRKEGPFQKIVKLEQIKLNNNWVDAANYFKNRVEVIKTL